MAMNYMMNAMKEARAAGMPMTGIFAERNSTIDDRLSVDGKPVAHELCYDHQGDTVRLAAVSHGETLNGAEACIDIERGSTVRLGYWLHGTHHEIGYYVVHSINAYMNNVGSQCACVVFIGAIWQGEAKTIDHV